MTKHATITSTNAPGLCAAEALARLLLSMPPSKPGYWTGGWVEKEDHAMVTRAVWVEDRGSPECHILDEPRCEGCKHQPKDPDVPHG